MFEQALSLLHANVAIELGSAFTRVYLLSKGIVYDGPTIVATEERKGRSHLLAYGEEAKQLVVKSNPNQPDIADKLFKDLGEQYVFEQSLRPFHSNPSTTIPNDQQAFAEFCYGSMVSCKEGNPFACARNLTRHTNH